MPRPRKQLICLATTPYYLVTTRCVRRAYLCGHDSITGQCFEHRRAWIENRIGKLCGSFSIGVCAYAIMSNHYHLVVKIDAERAAKWSDEQVLHRWCRLFKGPILVQRWLNREPLSEPEMESVRETATVCRKRLASLSWFMKSLNECIAKRANKEDDCTGHFWEARFHSQALPSEQALLAAMTYVDLNPIRAGLAATPEESDFTSIQARIANAKNSETRPPIGLLPCPSILGLNCQTYLNLVDATGRLAVIGKTGKIASHARPILHRLGFSEQEWMQASLKFIETGTRSALKPLKSA